MALHTRHWTCSRFAGWLRGTAYPCSATHEEWEAIRASAKAAHPFRYWLAETALDKLQDFVFYLPGKVDDLRHYILNRFVDKTHYCHTYLESGQWHEFEERVLYGLFGELVDFVECEQAWMNVIVSDNRPGRRWFRRFRSREDGLARLEWEESLVDDEGKPTHQAEAAIECRALYDWWTVTRPSRQDPWELEEPEAEDYEGRYGKVDALAESYHAEDDEMACRLIKLRRCLWT